MARGRVTASKSPAWKLACAAASARPARRAGIHCQRNGALQERGRCGDSAASARARPAERSSSVPRPPRQVQASLGRDARRADPDPSRGRLHRRGRDGRGADPRWRPSGRRRTGRVDARTRPAHLFGADPRPRPGRPQPCQPRASRRHGGAAKGHRAALRPRRGRAVASPEEVRGGAGRSSVRSC